MERSKYLFIIFLALIVVLLPVAAHPQSAERTAIYRSYIKGDMASWVPVMERIENESNPSHGRQLELLEYYYGYTGYLISEDRLREARTYIDKGERLIDRILTYDPDNVAVQSLKGSFMAYGFAVNKLKAVVSGRESKRLIEESYRKAPDNVRAVAEMANVYYHAPAMFGRDRDKGAELYGRAAELIEKQGDTNNNWYYIHLLTVLALHFEETGDYARAGRIYEKLLRIEPDYVTVRDELYPEFLKRSGGNF